jgi:hypothetical protein
VSIDERVHRRSSTKRCVAGQTEERRTDRTHPASYLDITYAILLGCALAGPISISGFVVKTHLLVRTSWQRSLCLAVAWLTAFVVSPSFVACGSDDIDGDFGFGQEDMAATIEGDWSGMIDLDGEESISFSLTLSQATLAEADSTVRQTLCGTRSFFQEASACVAVSEMAIVGTLTSGGSAEPVVGLFSIYGGALEQGDLTVKTEAGASYQASFRSGAFHDGSVSRGNESLGVFALQR